MKDINVNIYKSIVEEQPVGFAYIKVLLQGDGLPNDYELMDINHAFETLTGLKEKNVIGKRMTEILSLLLWKTEDVEDLRQLYDDVALNGGTKEIDKFSESLQHWYRITAVSSGKEYIATHLMDISKEMFHFTELDNFLDLLCIMDVDGNFIKVNTAWEDILGYSADDLENRQFCEFIHPDDIQPARDKMAKLKKQEKVSHFVNRYQCKNGPYKYIEWRLRPNGRLIYVAARDVTRSMKAEEKLKEQTVLLKQLLNSIPDFVFYKDSEGRYLGCNHEFTQFVGKSNNEIVGEDGSRAIYAGCSRRLYHT